MIYCILCLPFEIRKLRIIIMVGTRCKNMVCTIIFKVEHVLLTSVPIVAETQHVYNTIIFCHEKYIF